jgi:hypothetical protein
LSHEEYTDVHFVCGFATVLPLPLLNNISYDLLDDESPIDLYSLGFNSTCEEKSSFRVQTAVLNVKYNAI